MLKQSILLFFTIIISYSCNNKNTTKSNEQKTSNTFINFNKYAFNTIEGKEEKITLAKNYIYVLDFWYLECAPCVKQHKEIQKNQELLLKNNIKVIGISIDKSKENWKAYLNKHQYNWENYNQYFNQPNLKNDLNLKLFPSYFIIESNGNIKKKLHSFQTVMKALKLK